MYNQPIPPNQQNQPNQQTQPVVQQYQQLPPPQVISYNPYDNIKYNDLFSCFENDITTCLIGCLCPLYENSKISYKLATKNKRISKFELCFLPLSLTSFYNRKAINRMYSKTSNSNCSDCLITTFCFPCSVIQNSNNYNQIHLLNHV